MVYKMREVGTEMIRACEQKMHRCLSDEVCEVGYSGYKDRQRQTGEVLGKGDQIGHDIPAVYQGYDHRQEDIEAGDQSRRLVGGWTLSSSLILLQLSHYPLLLLLFSYYLILRFQHYPLFLLLHLPYYLLITTCCLRNCFQHGFFHTVFALHT